MKLKEINRTAIQSWSPAQHHPIFLATGTSAQQLDASFSTSATLEIFELDLAEPSLDMKSCATFSSSHRYHKLVWGPHGMDTQGLPSGVLIAGSENGDVILYDPAKIIAGNADVIIAQSDKHTGPVRALDVNPFQTNLVASGGNESEIYIWDMNNFGSPMTPGPKTQPLEDISCVAWNRQVQHILASANPSGRASIWDLRKNDLIIKVSDHSNRMHCSGLAWNPEVATQLVLASEDDRMPVIQMWDLRFATSPLKILENHTRGVLAIAWSLADPELLLSCGKDSKILCCDPNTAEILYELPTSTQWCFDIQWCPRNPAVLSAAAFDGHIDIYSIMGGSNQAQSQRHADQISTSFGNVDPFGTGQTLPPLQLPQTTAPPTTVNPLKKPPKWIRRPVGASFAFGGKLVYLDNTKASTQQPAAQALQICQVVTETAFLKRSDELQATLSAGSFLEFCQAKIDAAGNQFEKIVWSFLKVNFDTDIRCKVLELLGYNKEELALKITAALEDKAARPVQPEADEDPTALASLQPLAEPNLFTQCDDAPEVVFDLIAAAQLESTGQQDMEANLNLESDDPGVDPPLEKSLESTLAGTPEPSADQDFLENEEEDILLEEEVTATAEEELSPGTAEEELSPGTAEEELSPGTAEEEPSPGTAEEEPSPGTAEEEPSPGTPEEGPSPGRKTPTATEDPAGVEAPAPVTEGVSLSISQDVDGLITQALLTGNFEGAVELCLLDNRMADSIILAIAGGDELLKKTQKKYFIKTHSKLTKLISAVVMKDWHDILQTCALENWKEALAAVLTYAQPDEFSSLCDLLGGRLEEAEDGQLQGQACLCYICAGNVEKLVSCWARAHDGYCPLTLQDLVEKVVVLRRAVEQTQRSSPSGMGDVLAELMSQYANILASQGSLSTAITFLPGDTNQAAVQQLRDRLRFALGEQTGTPSAPAPAPTPTQTIQPQHAAGVPRHPYSSGQPAMVPQPAANPVAMPPPAPAQTQPRYYQPVRAASTVTSWSNQTPTALPNIPPPPLQLGTASEQQTEQSQPPYRMPPAGAAAAPPPSSTPAYMYSHQYQPNPPVNLFPPGAAPVYQPLQYSPAAPVPPLPVSSSSTPHAPGFLPEYMQPVPSQPDVPPYPGPPPVSQTMHASPPSHPPSFSTASSSFSPPSSSGASFQHSWPGAPVSYMPPPPPTGLSGPQNGWNDPPAVSRAPKKKVPENYTPPAPITAPIMAPLGSEQAQPASPVAPQTMVQSQPGVQAQYPGMQQQLAPPTANPVMPKTSVEGAPGAPTGDVIQPLQSIPAEKITKKPIPDEHLVLKTTFEGLIQKCLAVASDPQTKRKLDDAGKRLEALYDKLREQALSPAIVGGLHNMARSVESRSYTEGLNIHTHIVSNNNFSETSAFMPVLKVVLTQANKLGV
ncbi:protein transport protein Sec31A [Lampris incognitus]|uniref:protein transport protein Sec31A n=1 Tax=Lampris incognitus TaxID=2546036 RepID=UPI0024B61C70|nr:protein transport protein Sec31A [Lampris incognitus]